MPRVLRSRTILGLLILLFSSLATRHSSFLLAQTETASLGGAIRDPKGAVVPDAEVTAVRIETGAVSTTHTNGAGIYYFTGLQPGHYHLMIQKQGFKEIAIKDFELHIQDKKLEQNFTLEIGSVNETVTVKASGININTTDGTVSTLVDATTIANMPLNGRSFQDLILLTPGVATNSPQNTNNLGEFIVNGQRSDANYYTVDGVSANTGVATVSLPTGSVPVSGSLGASTAVGTTQSLVSVDDLQEFLYTELPLTPRNTDAAPAVNLPLKPNPAPILGTALPLTICEMTPSVPRMIITIISCRWHSLLCVRMILAGTLGGPVRMPRSL